MPRHSRVSADDFGHSVQMPSENDNIRYSPKRLPLLIKGNFPFLSGIARVRHIVETNQDHWNRWKDGGLKSCIQCPRAVLTKDRLLRFAYGVLTPLNVSNHVVD